MAVPKPKGSKSPVKKDPVQNQDFVIPEGELDINKLRTITGHGRELVQLQMNGLVMEFVQ